MNVGEEEQAVYDSSGCIVAEARSILSQASRSSKVPRIGAREFCSDPQQGRQRLHEAHTIIDECLCEERIVRRVQLSTASWDNVSCTAKLITKKTNIWEKIGSSDGTLYPEEVLFCVNQGLLELLLGDLPLCLQEVYSITLPCLPTFDYYQVYAHLARLGFVVRRHTGSWNSSSKQDAASPDHGSAASCADRNFDPELSTGFAKALWDPGDTIHPLLQPKHAISPASILSKLKVVPTCSMYVTSTESSSTQPSLQFDVYKPGKPFKKSQPGRPDFCIAVCSYHDPLPSLMGMLVLRERSLGVPLSFAVSGPQSVSLYTLSLVDVPTLIPS